MQPPNPLEPVLAHLRAEPSRTWSIIISFFGDAIVPRGGSVWLGTLLAFFKALDVSETVVRSAVSRLAAEDWLKRTKVGRHSFYHLAERGHATFAQAAKHIYHHDQPHWAGAFQALLVAPGGPEDVSEALRQAGFGALLPGMFVAPVGWPIPVLAQDMLCLTVGGSAEQLREVATRAWNLAELARLYQRFYEAFAPLQLALARGAMLSPLEAMLARVLLIHEYRRIALRDPMLPKASLPEGWPGEGAKTLCAAIYSQVLPASEAWLDAHALGEDSQPLPSNPNIYNRFKA